MEQEVLKTEQARQIRTENLILKFKKFILEQNHPCLMAQTIFSSDDFRLKSYNGLGSRKTAKRIYKDLEEYISSYDFTTNTFETFIAVFPSDNIHCEGQFESMLWDQLQHLHEVDTLDWDETVSDDPNNENFSFSIGGKAFYIVGMHPHSSRYARRAPFPTIVFNLHSQFEKLREMNTYKRVRNRIRSRDKKLQGFINPVLKDFGEESEARQYSGRKVEANWKCPFINKAS
ncbi:guanitoxin biosynthesis heme-dependent pre-guanitoxin N-hydroxylase GntA [Constantimarinum furrinae]|uniref:YqcI/YcgG family protein n=1 Tax=Constantimarinum furrinae TaxID=2562285 RepID=A0A7G8PWV7_9FLAO|nr:guanitoxin biosynthesis heme-dependent pre-guanitoxin N-hydroxylase GntA [Constantimarinum furrinae]QNJ98823.1 hypothetical protein ALE3EI_2281 [Constantimarinum furrinae]